jgi:hypothetical protein
MLHLRAEEINYKRTCSQKSSFWWIWKQIQLTLLQTLAMSTTQTITVQAIEEAPQKWTPHPPLKLSGALSSYKYFDVTPIIGREFVDVNLKEWLRAPNSDELIRDLAITSTYTLLPMCQLIWFV